MRVMPYDKERKFDMGLDFVINTVKKTIEDKDDDFLLLVCGFRGTGKTTLGLHIMDAYLKDEASVDYIGLNPSDFATALKKASDKPLPRLCNNDEANISKRDSQRRYNKDLLDLYYSIRGKQIFHIWNNPSLDIIDKKFIEDVIKGVIFVASKEINKLRIYYYFRKIDIIRLWEKYENLNIRTIKKVRKEYAYFRGWFKNYDGKLSKPYLEKKDKRMTEKVDGFFENYGNKEDLSPTKGYYKLWEVKELVGVSGQTLDKYFNKLKSENKLKPEDFILPPNGRRLYHENLIEVFKGMLKKNVAKKINGGKETKKIKKSAFREKHNITTAPPKR